MSSSLLEKKEQEKTITDILKSKLFTFLFFDPYLHNTGGSNDQQNCIDMVKYINYMKSNNVLKDEENKLGNFINLFDNDASIYNRIYEQIYSDDLKGLDTYFENNETLYLLSGYMNYTSNKGHAISLMFQKEENKFNVFVFNSGEGVDNHNKDNIHDKTNANLIIKFKNIEIDKIKEFLRVHHLLNKSNQDNIDLINEIQNIIDKLKSTNLIDNSYSSGLNNTIHTSVINGKFAINNFINGLFYYFITYFKITNIISLESNFKNYIMDKYLYDLETIKSYIDSVLVGTNGLNKSSPEYFNKIKSNINDDNITTNINKIIKISANSLIYIVINIIPYMSKKLLKHLIDFENLINNNFVHRGIDSNIILFYKLLFNCCFGNNFISVAKKPTQMSGSCAVYSVYWYLYYICGNKLHTNLFYNMKRIMLDEYCHKILTEKQLNYTNMNKLIILFKRENIDDELKNQLLTYIKQQIPNKNNSYSTSYLEAVDIKNEVKVEYKNSEFNKISENYKKCNDMIDNFFKSFDKEFTKILTIIEEIFQIYNNILQLDTYYNLYCQIIVYVCLMRHIYKIYNNKSKFIFDTSIDNTKTINNIIKMYINLSEKLVNDKRYYKNDIFKYCLCIYNHIYVLLFDMILDTYKDNDTNNNLQITNYIKAFYFTPYNYFITTYNFSNLKKKNDR